MTRDESRDDHLKDIIKNLKNETLQGEAWDDYDKDGIPYWEKWENK